MAKRGRGKQALAELVLNRGFNYPYCTKPKYTHKDGRNSNKHTARLRKGIGD
jgi:hypothetical protein